MRLKMDGPLFEKSVKMEPKLPAAPLTCVLASFKVSVAVGTRFEREDSTPVSVLQTPESSMSSCSTWMSLWTSNSPTPGIGMFMLLAASKALSTRVSTMFPSWSSRTFVVRFEMVPPTSGPRMSLMSAPISGPRMSSATLSSGSMRASSIGPSRTLPIIPPSSWATFDPTESKESPINGVAISTRSPTLVSMILSKSPSTSRVKFRTMVSRRSMPAGVAQFCIIAMKLDTCFTMDWICVAKLSSLLLEVEE
mmetsp:Transcript_93159/g.216515  ORF Transcript_93159/g.216515 Transcript_93159/m.216515 type:complete len:251 (+) Transcript_93159:845-1597(+)